MAYIPTWRDTEVILGTADSYTFQIRKGNSSIYQGVAKKKQWAGDVRIKINNIIQQYFEDIYYPWDATTQRTRVNTFSVYVWGTNDWTLIGSYDFYYGYDHTDWGVTDISAFKLNRPVIYRIAPWQYVFYDANCDASHTRNLTVTNGTATTTTINTNVTKRYQLATGASSISFNVPGISYDWYGVGCGDYALYYRNLYGAWDTLLLEGQCSKSAKITRNTYDTEYWNINNIGNKANYLNVSSDSYVLRTGWLADEESERMQHLFRSTSIKLHERVTTYVHPVIITDTSFQYKTFKSNGKRLVSYEINVDVCNEQIVR